MIQNYKIEADLTAGRGVRKLSVRLKKGADQNE